MLPAADDPDPRSSPTGGTQQCGPGNGGSHPDWRGKHGGVVPPLPTPSGELGMKMHTRRGVCASVEINKTQGCVSDIFYGK